MINKLLFFSDDNDIPKEVDDKINSKVGRLMPGNYAKLRSRQKYFDCKILDHKVHDLPAPIFMTKPLKTIPETLKSDYTYDGRIVVKSYFIDYNFPTNRTSRMLIIIF